MPQASQSRFRPQSLPDCQSLLGEANVALACLSLCSQQIHVSLLLHPAPPWLRSFIPSLSDQTSRGCQMSVLDSRTRDLLRGLSSLVRQRQPSRTSSPAMEPLVEVRQRCPATATSTPPKSVHFLLYLFVLVTKRCPSVCVGTRR